MVAAGCVLSEGPTSPPGVEDEATPCVDNGAMLLEVGLDPTETGSPFVGLGDGDRLPVVRRDGVDGFALTLAATGLDDTKLAYISASIYVSSETEYVVVEFDQRPRTAGCDLELGFTPFDMWIELHPDEVASLVALDGYPASVLARVSHDERSQSIIVEDLNVVVD